MKDRIYQYMLKKVKGVSFVELSRDIEGFKGDMQWMQGENRNIIFWIGLSGEAADALDALLKEKKIEMQPTHWLTYIADGQALTLPLVKRNYQYKTPHWLPVAFNLSKTSFKKPSK